MMLRPQICRPLTACALSLAIIAGLGAAPLRPARATTDDESSAAAGAYLAARHAERGRDHGNAARFLERALAREPGNFDLLQRAHVANVNEGRFDVAIELARRVVELSSANPQANITLAVDAIRRGRWDEAARRLKELPLQGINRIALPMLRAWVHAGLGEFDAALAALKPLADITGFRPLVEMHNGLLADLAGRGDEAEAAFRRALDAEEVPLRIIEAAVHLFAGRGKVDEARALLTKNGTPFADSIAFEHLERKLSRGEAIGRFIADPRAGAAEALFDVASAVRGELGGAVSLTHGRYALALMPDDASVLLLVGDVLDQQKRPAESSALLARVPASSPLSWSARLRIAENLHEVGRGDEAAEMFERMAAERGDRIDPLLALGALRRQQERYAEAAVTYERALARVATPTARHWSVFYARGISHERAKQWPKAEADFLKALELQPEQPDVMNYLAYSWIDQGQSQHYERATKMLQRAVELRPNSGHIIDSLAWAFYRLGRFDEAVPLLERAVEILPQDPTILDHLGDAYWRVGRQNEARYQWQRALGNKPEVELRGEIERKLQNGLPPPAPRGG
jgi:tetratricopeptide (TPR) repeat protein